ncbi:MAG TPA: glycosyltransferase, partial [Planctomycetaceae bacterium]|nr:glycosyltransferase [Planctomycetaceae bacterium]
MRILFLISGKNVPSSRYRVLAFLPYLRARGHVCHVATSFPPKYEHIKLIGWRASRRLQRWVRLGHCLLARMGRYDVVVLERELFDDNTWDIEQRLRRMAKRMVLDVDDAIFLRYPEKFGFLVRMSDWVIAGNRFLAERIEQSTSRVMVIPTCVDLQDYSTTHVRKPAKPIIGWVGTPSNLPNLDIIAPALRRVAVRRDFELQIVTCSRASLPLQHWAGVPVRFVPWRADREAEQISRFDIGLMPLDAHDEWNRFKCGLKLIQYMAARVAAVASPVGVNTEILDEGKAGLLAETVDDWEDAIVRLLDDQTLRRTLGEAGYRMVERRYSA